MPPGGVARQGPLRTSEGFSEGSGQCCLYWRTGQLRTFCLSWLFSVFPQLFLPETGVAQKEQEMKNIQVSVSFLNPIISDKQTCHLYSHSSELTSASLFGSLSSAPPSPLPPSFFDRLHTPLGQRPVFSRPEFPWVSPASLNH